jgi:hypothetical protein
LEAYKKTHFSASEEIPQYKDSLECTAMITKTEFADLPVTLPKKISNP